MCIRDRAQAACGGKARERVFVVRAVFFCKDKKLFAAAFEDLFVQKPSEIQRFAVDPRHGGVYGMRRGAVQ